MKALIETIVITTVPALVIIALMAAAVLYVISQLAIGDFGVR